MSPDTTGSAAGLAQVGGLGQVSGLGGLILVVAIGAFIAVFLLCSAWALLSMLQERRKGLHLHADGTLHSHLDGHKAHVHPMTATVTGWRRVKATLWQGEIENVPGINIHERIDRDERGDDFFWFGRR